MTKPSNFNGADKPAKTKTPERIALVAHLLNNPGPHTYDQLAQATGYSRHIIESRLKSAAEDNEVVNTAPPGKHAKWQHRAHHKTVKPVDMVKPREHTNATMPNGNRTYWGAQMAAFNTPPRSI